MSQLKNPLVLFEDLADQTWQTVSDSFKLSLGFGEESVTDIILLAIRRAGLPEVQAVKTYKAQEAILGIDWDFWIYHRHYGTIRYYIQAKKLNLSDDRYDALAHLVSERPRREQIDVLEAAAAQAQAVPLYCLYNGIQPEVDAAERHPNTWSVPIEQYGCTIAALDTVRQALNTRGARTFHRLHSRKWVFPWRYLFVFHAKFCGTHHIRSRPPLWPSAPVRTYSEVPRAILSYVSGERTELPRDFYPDPDEALPKRTVVVDITDVRQDED